MTVVPIQETAFDAAAYDLPGTPTLNGHKATNIILAFDNHLLKHRIASDMELAGQFELGQPITLTVTATLNRRDWAEKPISDTGEAISVTYRINISDITT